MKHFTKRDVLKNIVWHEGPERRSGTIVKVKNRIATVEYYLPEEGTLSSRFRRDYLSKTEDALRIISIF